MPYLSPPALTRREVESILSVTHRHPRDHLIIALALGTGLRLGEIVGPQSIAQTLLVMVCDAARRE